MWPTGRRAVLSISPSIRIFVHALPTDMRKHFDGLCAIVTQSFGKDVLHGDYFVFLNRSRDARSFSGIGMASWFGQNGWNAVPSKCHAV